MSTPAPTPIEVKLGDGSVIKGATVEEAIQNAVKRVEDNVTAYKAEKQRREELETEAATLRQQIEAKNRPPENGNGFQRDRYYQMLNDDPIAAQNYIDQYRFGVPDPVAEFNSMRVQISAMNQQGVVAAFTALHADDFPATAEAAKILTQRTEQLVNSGFPFNVDTVNYAYSQAVQDGSIKPLEKTEEEHITPPPALSGSSGEISSSEAARLESMSDGDIEKLLRSKGMIR